MTGDKLLLFDPYQVLQCTVDYEAEAFVIGPAKSFTEFTNKEDGLAHFKKQSAKLAKSKPKNTLLVFAHLLGEGRASVWEAAAFGYKYKLWAEEVEQQARTDKDAGRALFELDDPARKAAKSGKRIAPSSSVKGRRPSAAVAGHKRIKPAAKGIGALTGARSA